MFERFNNSFGCLGVLNGGYSSSGPATINPVQMLVAMGTPNLGARLVHNRCTFAGLAKCAIIYTVLNVVVVRVYSSIGYAL